MHTVIAILVVVVIGVTCIAAQHYNENIDSQFWLNGTTSVSRRANQSHVRVHFNHPWNYSIPVFNYSHGFNGLQRQQQQQVQDAWGLGPETTKMGPEWENIPEAGTVETTTIGRRMQQECKDDKVELDFLQGRKISLEIDLLKLENSFNFTYKLLEDCRRDVVTYKSLLNNNNNK